MDRFSQVPYSSHRFRPSAKRTSFVLPKRNLIHPQFFLSCDFNRQTKGLELPVQAGMHRQPIECNLVNNCCTPVHQWMSGLSGAPLQVPVWRRWLGTHPQSSHWLLERDRGVNTQPPHKRVSKAYVLIWSYLFHILLVCVSHQLQRHLALKRAKDFIRLKVLSETYNRENRKGTEARQASTGNAACDQVNVFFLLLESRCQKNETFTFPEMVHSYHA